MDRTHPRCEDKTVDSFQGACQLGVGILSLFLALVDSYFGTKEHVREKAIEAKRKPSSLSRIILPLVSRQSFSWLQQLVPPRWLPAPNLFDQS